MSETTDFLRSLTSSLDMIDKRLAVVEKTLNHHAARLLLVQAKLDDCQRRLQTPVGDALTPVLSAAMAAVDQVFVEA